MYCAEVLFQDPGQTALRDGLFALRREDLKVVAKRGQSVAVAQLFGLVLPGLIMTKHVFQGLKRPLYTDGNMHADGDKLTYTRKPAFDCAWTGGAHGSLVTTDPPPGAVFAVYVTPNVRHREQYPEIDGWINYWTWLDEDQALAEAPLDWVGRYGKRLWTRSTP